ncbi:unnamed protein product, partial [Oncorhynchus mykiss]
MPEVKQQAGSWVPLLAKRCHADTQVFLCSLFAPVCLDRPIYPCRSLCEAVRDSCAPVMETYGFPWPEMLTCDKFPIDNDLCIPIQFAGNQATPAPGKTTHACIHNPILRPYTNCERGPLYDMITVPATSSVERQVEYGRCLHTTLVVDERAPAPMQETQSYSCPELGTTQSYSCSRPWNNSVLFLLHTLEQLSLTPAPDLGTTQSYSCSRPWNNSVLLLLQTLEQLSLTPAQSLEQLSLTPAPDLGTT